MPLTGGPATEIAAITRISGASWSDDDRIAVGTEFDGIILLSATGATPPDTILRGDASLPHFLPGGETLLRLCTALTRYWDMRGHWNEGREWLEQDMDARSRRVLSGALNAT